MLDELYKVRTNPEPTAACIWQTTYNKNRNYSNRRRNETYHSSFRTLTANSITVHTGCRNVKHCHQQSFQEHTHPKDHRQATYVLCFLIIEINLRNHLTPYCVMKVLDFPLFLFCLFVSLFWFVIVIFVVWSIFQCIPFTFLPSPECCSQTHHNFFHKEKATRWEHSPSEETRSANHGQ